MDRLPHFRGLDRGVDRSRNLAGRERQKEGRKREMGHGVVAI
jgi:hypothetical protein